MRSSDPCQHQFQWQMAKIYLSERKDFLCLDGGGRINGLTNIRFVVTVAVDSNVPAYSGDLEDLGY